MTCTALIEKELTGSIIGAFYEVYNTLGYGFLEHIYVAALERELRARGHAVAREVWVQVTYKNEIIGTQRLDMLVDEKVVVEVKATRDLHKSATRQLYNYLRATSLDLGLLLHFGPEPFFHRVICRDHKRGPRSWSLSHARSQADEQPQHPSIPQNLYRRST